MSFWYNRIEDPPKNLTQKKRVSHASPFLVVLISFCRIFVRESPDYCDFFQGRSFFFFFFGFLAPKCLMMSEIEMDQIEEEWRNKLKEGERRRAEGGGKGGSFTEGFFLLFLFFFFLFFCFVLFSFLWENVAVVCLLVCVWLFVCVRVFVCVCLFLFFFISMLPLILSRFLRCRRKR